MLAFDLRIDPPKSAGKNSKSAYVVNGRAVVTESKRTKGTKELLAGLIAPYAPSSPIEGPVEIELRIAYPWPKSTPKKVMRQGSRPHVKRPDADAMLTTVMDVMTSLRFWRDDSQVWCATVIKSESDLPGMSVTVMWANDEAQGAIE